MSAPEIEFALSAADGALGLLPSAEREDAEELIALCRSVWFHQDAGEKSEILKTAGRLIEVLARRSAAAMPYAALARALVAELRGSPAERNALLAEFQMKLSLLGM